MKSLIKDTPRPSFIKRMIPPLYKDLLLWANRHYYPTTHTIKSRLTPAYDVTLKQGLVFSSAGAGCLNYGLRNLISTSTNKMRWQFKFNAVGNGAIASEYQTTGNKRGWWLTVTGGNLSLTVGQSGGAFPNAGSMTFGSTTFSNGDVVDFIFNAGVGMLYVNGVLEETIDISGTLTTLYNNGGDLNVAGFNNNTASSLNGSISDMKIWSENIEDTDTPVFCAPMGDGQGIDLISGTIPAVVGTVDMTARADDASYDCEDNGFAVQGGDIYPKNYAGTGYAGLVGDPDATYHGLIALKGQIEVAGQAYLGTLFDFEQSPNTPITDAGISWDEWDDTDDNLDTVGTAETDLDTDYYNAITASLMTNTSIAGYAGTSNVKSRLFFKVADRVMKGDGSYLAESGKVMEILVYNRDLSASEILRVQKYCREVTE